LENCQSIIRNESRRLDTQSRRRVNSESIRSSGTVIVGPRRETTGTTEIENNNLLFQLSNARILWY